MKMSDLNPYREADRDPVHDQGVETDVMLWECWDIGRLIYKTGRMQI